MSIERAELLFPSFRQDAVLTDSIGYLPAGARVELLTAESQSSFTVSFEGKSYEVPWSSLSPLPPTVPFLPTVSDGEIAAAADAFGLTSETPYLLWTDLWRLQTYVLRRDDDTWQLERRIPCSAGDLSHPTPRGLYRIGSHTLSLGREGKYLTVYALHICGDYLYHSVILTPEGNELSDGRLGERISRGCIRHSVEESRRLYHTIPDGTSVLIR